jgi:hypothetical protein
MNKELSKIEKTFLAKRNIKSAMNLTAINKGIDEDLKIGAKKFEGSIALSKHVLSAFDWYKSSEGKEAMKKASIEWGTEKFALKVFGWGKSYMHKMIKVGRMTDLFTDAFKRRVLIDSDYRTAVASIIKFADIVNLSEFESDVFIDNAKTQAKIDAEVARQLEMAKAQLEAEEAYEEQIEESEETEESEESEETADDTLVMLNMNAVTPLHDGAAVVWRLDADLNVHTTNSKEEMLRAMDELKAIIEANM